MSEIIISPEEVKKLRHFKENIVVFNKYYEDLRSHVGKYVAIGDGKILDYSDNKEALEEKYHDIEGLFVELITPYNITWIL